MMENPRLLPTLSLAWMRSLEKYTTRYRSETWIA